ncbi:MAG: crosslink repair DNA glycosylase YcaQ family protein [Rhizobiaceae bacterium]|nr:crosslink repair DNA glycosylase YcaQ family protein [Rhizobiaceae bacterium]
MIHLDNKTARHVVLHLQGLTRAPHIAFEKNGLADLIYQLGFVQMDSIPWVERAHHMILFARNQTYRTKHLSQLHEKEQQLFENWTHDASLIPCEFWPYWKQKFRRDEPKLKEKFIKWQGAGFMDRVEALRDRIEQNGVLRSRDLEKPKGQKLEMWQWHDGKAALEYMWRTGQFAVAGRDGFQKIYDLCYRVIHDDHYGREVSHEEFVDWACRSALDRLGFGTPADIARYWDLLSISEVKDWLDARAKQETKTVIADCCDGSNPKEFFARPDIETIIGKLDKLPDRIRMLSPFDPVIRDRKRLKWLFGFDYTIEIYVPPEKRKYGYYIFPLLERDKLIGRVDAQAKRKEDILTATKLWLEDGIKWSASRDEKFKAELIRQSRLCETKRVDWHKNRIVT